MRKRLLQISLMTLALVLGALTFQAQPAHALSGSDFNPGRIIDDSVFFNKDAMSVSDIQSFLQSKVPSCDTNHTSGNSSYSPPWTCLYQYRENTTTHANNIGNPSSNPAGSITAAQIIYNAAQSYNISPKVLLVLLQKEQSLITDTWPYPSQYRSATGYGCPDSSVCDSQYYGFYNQVTKAAYQFRRYATYPDQYNYVAGQNNNIPYNPNGGCGYKTVYIQNQATAGLYNYTPYVPNTAALNNLYGLGDGCSAYGNRNFWRLYNDWFGSPTAAPYAWKVVDQRVKAYVTGEDLDISAGLPAGERVVFYVRAQNTGTQTWSKSGSNPTRLGASRPNERTSVFCETSWIACHRPVGMSEATVAPGEVGTFQFAVQAPLTPGQYKEYFNLLAEGVSWMQDIGLYFNIKVIDAPLSYSLVSSTLPSNMTAGQTSTGVITIKNTGSAAWYNVAKYPARLGTASPYDRPSAFQSTDWISTSRAAEQNEFRVLPGEDSTFNVSLRAPNTNGSYTEKFAVLLEGYRWGTATIPISITVSGGATPAAQPGDELDSGQAIGLNQSLRSPNGSYRLTLQGDGNLVLYANATRHVLWMTGTQGRSTARLVMQPDGNIVLYDTHGRYIWGTRTNGTGGTHLVMQNDGNLVLFNASNRAVWTTGTAGRK